MASPPVTRYTPEEYLEFERVADYKSEYLAGEIFAMAGASEAHNLVTVNVTTSIVNQLRGKPCRTYAADMRVNMGSAFVYPDVVVVCGEVKLLDRFGDTLLNPTVIVEVLSKSTEAYDRGEKFARYREIDSLQEYILVSQDRASIERFVRQEDNKWLMSQTTGFDNSVSIESIDCRLNLADVYDKVDFVVAETAA